jgi:hypothetical protein
MQTRVHLTSHELCALLLRVEAPRAELGDSTLRDLASAKAVLERALLRAAAVSTDRAVADPLARRRASVRLKQWLDAAKRAPARKRSDRERARAS